MPKRFDDRAGPSQRQLRVGELIRRTLSDILLRGDLHDPDLAGVSITVGEVRTSPDLRVATVFVLPLGGQNAETILAALNRARNELRRELSREVRLRHSPELRFVVDESFDRMDRTREMLSDERVRRDLDEEE
ncbi:MAG TPA: 30S ribosome-binding factor RbfA [Paracoccaceae bacterium]|nr:30S ribosome-binding factor RbfA [Paracoccaceae bacterium]